VNQTTETDSDSDSNADSNIGEAAERLARRPWPATPIRSGLDISFEFFPTATEKGAENLTRCATDLEPLGPRFVSVTYGAGGSDQDRTLNTIARLRADTNLEVAGHLTTVGASRSETIEVVDRYRELGVNHVVALRGDPPPTDDGAPQVARNDGFTTAAELVAGIRNHVGNDMEISVACYPEVHPRAVSPQADLDRLKEKVDAGADRAITQFFYDNEAFLRFQDRCRDAGISVPIVAGIMPIGSFTRVANFASRCGANIPDWMPSLFEGLDDAPEIHQLVAATIAAEQCRELAERGVRHFHFYTMNKPELTAAICRILGIRPGVASAAGSAAISA
jgi:methylenetetrahydrofolate reductase (NADPH)